MKSIFGLLCQLAVLLPALAWGHAGHDENGHAVPGAALAPRAEAVSTTVELVAVAVKDGLLLYVDHFASNEPLVKARIEIELAGDKLAAEEVAPGTYRAQTSRLAAPGTYEFMASIEAGNVVDLLTAQLVVASPPGQESAGMHVPGNRTLLWAGGAAAALALAIAPAVRRRRKARSAALALPLIAAFLYGEPQPALAHAGEDHGKSEAPTATPAPAPSGAASMSEAPRRLSDGTVLVPKSAQRALGVRTALVEKGMHRATVELRGLVASDPSAGGKVQAPFAGRIEPAPRGLPSLGMRVEKGQLLGYLAPSAGALERGDARGRIADYAAQLELTERRLARYEALEGSVPQKDIDAARAEVAGLRERRAALTDGLAGREPLQAPASGIVSDARVVAGQLVEGRELLFEIVNPQRLLVEALAFDASLATLAGKASALTPAGERVVLAFLGAGRRLREQAIPLVFRVESPAPALAVGMPLRVFASSGSAHEGVTLPGAALTRGESGETFVWEHASAERFRARRVTTRPVEAGRVLVEGLAGGERIVVQGATLLAQVR